MRESCKLKVKEKKNFCADRLRALKVFGRENAPSLATGAANKRYIFREANAL